MTTPLREILHTRQVPGEPRRRWFSNEDMDLVVWLGDDGAIAGFQLCYDKLHGEHAITWHDDTRRLSHMAVDDGEQPGMNYKATPVLVPDGALDARSVLARFTAASAELPTAVVAAVTARLGSGGR